MTKNDPHTPEPLPQACQIEQVHWLGTSGPPPCFVFDFPSREVFFANLAKTAPPSVKRSLVIAPKKQSDNLISRGVASLRSLMAFGKKPNVTYAAKPAA